MKYRHEPTMAHVMVHTPPTFRDRVKLLFNGLMIGATTWVVMTILFG